MGSTSIIQIVAGVLFVVVLVVLIQRRRTRVK
jgi:tetrahydromethanopterin S-methyltransferase subunit F